MVRAWEKLLKLFPVSKLSKRTSTLRIQAVSMTEPPLYEESYETAPDMERLMGAVREFSGPDTAIVLEAEWDLWQYDREWKLAPSSVMLMCFGPDFETAREDDIRIDFGIDSHFLPQPDLPNYLFMARSNIRSLLHLVHEMDSHFRAESRKLWTESGENFAERLQQSLAEETPPGEAVH